MPTDAAQSTVHPRLDARPPALRVYAAHYDQLVGLLEQNRHVPPERRLRYVQQAAEFASTHHPGRFADGAIENAALELGIEIERLGRIGDAMPARDGLPQGRRRVLHVATSAVRIGGHTRTINQWVRLDVNSGHSVFLTDQREVAVPAWLSETVEGLGGQVIVLPGRMGMIDRARCLREYARNWDLVVLHHASSDVVPSLAFATAPMPPVCVYNHADHLFWLGSSVTDMVIDGRAAGARVTAERRFVAQRTILPLPLARRLRISRREARNRLGIPPDQLMLLSIGRGEKYRPTPTHNFFRTMGRLLRELPSANLYLVGMTESEAVDYGHTPDNRRIHFCGRVDDASVHQAAADIYLEGFPFGSATALLETALAGVPVALPYSPALDLLVTNHGINDLVPNPQTENDYIERIRELADCRERRESAGAAIREHVESHHTNESWRWHLAAVYAMAEGLHHRPRPIPRATCCESALDLALSDWQSSARGRKDVESESREAARGVLFDSAYGARDTHDYAGALALFVQGTRLWGCDQRALMGAAKLPAHWLWHSLRQG